MGQTLSHERTRFQCLHCPDSQIMFNVLQKQSKSVFVLYLLFAVVHGSLIYVLPFVNRLEFNSENPIKYSILLLFPGRTHDNTFALYHLGQRATDGVKQFAETGKSDILENLSSKPKKQPSSSAKMKSSSLQNGLDRSNSNNDDSSKWNKRNPIFDDFTLPPITIGSGRSESKFFVDGNHSHVSLMTKILPSPDWFIGVDSFQVIVFARRM